MARRSGGNAFGVGGNGGAGGAGISGSDLIVVNATGGTISGGAGGAAGTGIISGAAGASGNAVTFTGGTNIFELQGGSTVNGNVVAFSALDTFVLGGSTNASFNTTLLNTQFTGFGVSRKVDRACGR